MVPSSSTPTARSSLTGTSVSSTHASLMQPSLWMRSQASGPLASTGGAPAPTGNSPSTTHSFQRVSPGITVRSPLLDNSVPQHAQAWVPHLGYPHPVPTSRALLISGCIMGICVERKAKRWKSRLPALPREFIYAHGVPVAENASTPQSSSILPFAKRHMLIAPIANASPGFENPGLGSPL